MKITSPMIFLFGVIGVMGFLFLTGNLSGNVLFILTILMIGAILFQSRTKEIVGYKRAKEIAINSIKELIKNNIIEPGEVYEMPEVMLRYSVIPKSPEPEVIPDYWDVGVVAGDNAYLIKVSVDGGEILGTSEIELPSEFRVLKEPMYRVVAGKREEVKESEKT